jgi:predicted N-acyltransferase
LRFVSGMHEFDASEWNALAGPQPFLRHAFLHALEASGCVRAETGWQPHHLGLWRGGSLAAAMPLYLKSHSYGEYVFDWRWADAYEQAGGRYFPKLLNAIPFTPVPGPRLLARSDEDRVQLAEAALALAAEAGLSSLHCLFPDVEGDRALARAGLMQRQGYQFHWPNPGYADFDEFLATLAHDKRKKIRQERRKVMDAGLRFETRTGTDIRESHWAFFHRCYEHTYRLHRSTPYLNLEFFLRLGEALPGHTMMVLGCRGSQPVCAALDLYDSERLYGRYWGALEYVPGLHFETCYYQGMEFCIGKRLKIFEGGAQGEHKLARGFLPVATRSWHWLADDRFGKAVNDFLKREGRAVEEYVSELEGPYKQGTQP